VSVRLEATLYAVFPGTELGTPTGGGGDNTPFGNLSEVPAVPWQLWGCTVGDPTATYPGITGPGFVDVTDVEFYAPPGAYLITSGLHPGGGAAQAIDVTWTPPAGSYVQFYLRTVGTTGYEPEITGNAYLPPYNDGHLRLRDRGDNPSGTHEWVSFLDDFSGNLVYQGGLGYYRLFSTRVLSYTTIC
jgi:hypothetical protein